MDRVDGAQHIQEGLLEALTQGVGVTARILWLTHSKKQDRGTTQGKERWVHCTPLLGSDDNVGVWMIGMFHHSLPPRRHVSKRTLANGEIQ